MLHTITTIVILFFLTITSGAAYSQQDKSRLLFRSFRGQEHLSPALKSSTIKTALQYVAGLKNFQLVLSSASPPSESFGKNFALEGEITKDPKGYRVVLELLDLKNEVRVNRVQQDSVREEDLNRMIKAGLEALFLPVIKLPSPPSDRSSYEREVLPQIVVGSNPEKVIDFRKRILSLQQEADEAIIKKALDSEKDEDSKKRSKTASSSSSPMKTNQMNVSEIKEGKRKDPNARQYQISLSGERRIIRAESIVETDANLNVINISGRSDLKNFLQGRLRNGAAFSFYSPLEASIEGQKIEVPNFYEFGLYSEFRFDSLSMMALDLKREEMVFFNLISPGAGITAGKVSASWLGIRGNRTHHLFNRDVNFEAGYAILTGLTTDWEGPIDQKNQSQGSSFKFKLSIYKAIYGVDAAFELSQQQWRLGAQEGLKIQDLRTLFTLAYNF